MSMVSSAYTHSLCYIFMGKEDFVLTKSLLTQESKSLDLPHTNYEENLKLEMCLFTAISQMNNLDDNLYKMMVTSH